MEPQVILRQIEKERKRKLRNRQQQELFRERVIKVNRENPILWMNDIYKDIEEAYSKVTMEKFTENMDNPTISSDGIVKINEFSYTDNDNSKSIEVCEKINRNDQPKEDEYICNIFKSKIDMNSENQKTIYEIDRQGSEMKNISDKQYESHSEQNGIQSKNDNEIFTDIPCGVCLLENIEENMKNECSEQNYQQSYFHNETQNTNNPTTFEEVSDAETGKSHEKIRKWMWSTYFKYLKPRKFKVYENEKYRAAVDGNNNNEIKEFPHPHTSSSVEVNNADEADDFSKNIPEMNLWAESQDVQKVSKFKQLKKPSKFKVYENEKYRAAVDGNNNNEIKEFPHPHTSSSVEVNNSDEAGDFSKNITEMNLWAKSHDVQKVSKFKQLKKWIRRKIGLRESPPLPLTSSSGNPVENEVNDIGEHSETKLQTPIHDEIFQ